MTHAVALVLNALMLVYWLFEFPGQVAARSRAGIAVGGVCVVTSLTCIALIVLGH